VTAYPRSRLTTVHPKTKATSTIPNVPDAAVAVAQLQPPPSSSVDAWSTQPPSAVEQRCPSSAQLVRVAQERSLFMAARHHRFIDGQVVSTNEKQPRDLIADLGAFSTLQMYFQNSIPGCTGMLKIKHGSTKEPGRFLELGASTNFDLSSTTPAFVTISNFLRFVTWECTAITGSPQILGLPHSIKWPTYEGETIDADVDCNSGTETVDWGIYRKCDVVAYASPRQDALFCSTPCQMITLVGKEIESARECTPRTGSSSWHEAIPEGYSGPGLQPGLDPEREWVQGDVPALAEDRWLLPIDGPSLSTFCSIGNEG